jgi:hypothetical protein
MPLQTKLFEFSSSFRGVPCGIGLWRDSQQERTYFYSAFYLLSDYSDIRRISVDDSGPTEWEFVGRLNFVCNLVTISACGDFFWSVELGPTWYSRTGGQMSLRKVNFRTLEFEVFQMSGN